MPVSPLWSSFPRTPVTPGKWPDPGRGPWGCRGGRGWASWSPRHRAGQACTRTVRCWGSGGDHSLYLWPAYEKVSDWEVKYKSKIIPVYGIKRDILLRKSCYVKPGSLFLYFALNTSRTLNLSDNTVMISTNRQLKSIFNLIIIANEFFSVSGWVFFSSCSFTWWRNLSICFTSFECIAHSVVCDKLIKIIGFHCLSHPDCSI